VGGAAPPAAVRATGGAGLVQVDWEPVEGALGYLVHRAKSADGPFEPVDHLGGDVLAVPCPPYADTTIKPGGTAWYAVATWTEAGAGPLSTPTAARASTRPTGDEGRVEVAVDAGAVTGPLDRSGAA